MRLEATDLALRSFRPDDREVMTELANNPNVVRYLAERFPFPYRLADADGWIELTQGETRPVNFAIEWNGAFVGGIGLVPLSDVHSGTANLGYWLGEPYWRHGLAARSVGLLLPYAFEELLFIRIQALVYQNNAASMRVLEKSGFVREGIMRKHVRKNGVILDAVLYAKLRNP